MRTQRSGWLQHHPAVPAGSVSRGRGLLFLLDLVSGSMAGNMVQGPGGSARELDRARTLIQVQGKCK